ncbi:MAG TPA: HD domain-containing protein [Patescibacteria group bacterium]|jgi:putative hydrolase of HD superfamily|nr:HD domain-containing protein [Patescibacteria group bacterium]
MEIDNIINFIKLINQFREIERVIFMKDSDRRENDIEHSYQLAMCAWYVISTNKLPLNVEQAVKYALVHDLVEIYAGDVLVYEQNDPVVKKQKEERELEALEKLKIGYSEFPEMTDLIEGYQTKADEESKFVYALDKLIAPINLYLDNGRMWHEYNISFDKFYSTKKPKAHVYPEVGKYFDQLVEILEKEKEDLFHNDNN